MNFKIYQNEQIEDQTVLLKTTAIPFVKNFKIFQKRTALSIIKNACSFGEFKEEIVEQFRLIQHHFRFTSIRVELSGMYYYNQDQDIDFYNFLLSLFQFYSSSLVDVTFECIDFHKFVVKDNPLLDSQQKVLTSLLNPLSSLKHLFILEQLNIESRQLPSSILNSVNKMLQEQTTIKNIQSLFFGLQFSTERSDQKKHLSPFQQELNKLCELLSQLQSLSSLSLQLNNLSIEPHILQKVFQNISKIKNLAQLRLDVSHNRNKISDQIKNLEFISKYQSNLLEFSFIDDQVYKKKEIEQFCQQISSLKKLNKIQLGGSILKQEQIIKYFDMLKSLINLSHISLDMSEFYMNKDHFEYAFKTLQSISKTLKSINFILPSHHIFTLKDQQNLLGFLIQAKDNLIELHLTFTNQFEEQGFIEFLNEFPKLVNLKLLALQFQGKEYSTDYYTIDVRNNREVPNIFELKELDFSLCNSLDKLKYFKVITSSLLKAQRNKLESFTYEEPSFYFPEKDNSLLTTFSNENMKSLLNQNQLKYIKFQYFKLQKLIDVKQFLENNNSQMLSLSISMINSISYIDVLLKIQNIVSLNLTVGVQLPDNFLLSIIDNYPLLQKLQFFDAKYKYLKFDYRKVVQSQYLLEITGNCINSSNDKFHQLIKERRSMVLTMLIYQNLIQPLLDYSPSYSHLDLYLD